MKIFESCQTHCGEQHWFCGVVFDAVGEQEELELFLPQLPPVFLDVKLIDGTKDAGCHHDDCSKDEENE